MVEDPVKNLVSELENISKDQHLIVHILDFGFLAKEGTKFSGILSTSYSNKNDGSLILFKEDSNSEQSGFISNNTSNNQKYLLNSSESEEIILTVLISNASINNINFNIEEHIFEGIKDDDHSSFHVDDLKSSITSTSKFIESYNSNKLNNNLRNELFKGIEVEISIKKDYPKIPLTFYCLSYYNIDKNGKDLIRCNVENYMKDIQHECSLTGLLLVFKESLRNIIEQENKAFISTSFQKFYQNENFVKTDLKNNLYKKATQLPISEAESGLYRLSHGRFEDNFEIIRILGYGGFGSVFMAREKFGGKCTYAIKQIPLSSHHIHENQLLINEAAMLACLNHEKIVRYYHAWIQESVGGQTRYINNELLDRNICSSFAPELLSQFSAITAQYISDEDSITEELGVMKKETSYTIRKKLIYLYIQMEYCSGYSLQFAIDQGLLFNNHKLIWHIFYQIIQGLSYLHGKGVIHRDLKPSNIFLQLDDSNASEKESDDWFLVKLGDFGLTTFVNIFEDISYDNSNFGSKVNKELSSGVGTLFYMAPEQCKGNNYNQSADMFSLGVILFEMYHPSFKTGMERVQILTQLTKYRIIPENCNIPNKVRRLIKSLLNSDPKERPTSYQLLYNEWILKQTKIYLQYEDETNKDLNKNNIKDSRREYSSLKICDLINRNPHIHENIQIISTLFSIEKRFSDMLNYRNKNYFSYLFRVNATFFKANQFQSCNLLLNHHYYYRKRLELIVSIKNIFRTHGATEVEIPILIPKNNNKNIRIDENTQYEINDNDNNINIEHDYFLISNNERTQSNLQLRNKKNKKSINKKTCQTNKLDTEMDEDISASDSPLNVLLLDKSGTPLILCNNILKNMSAQFGDGQGLRVGAVIKRFYIDSIYTQDNFINAEAGNYKGKVTNAHPKEILLGAYEIIVKINDSISEEFDDGLNFMESPDNNQSNNANMDILPIWYYNIVVYYDIETVITALDTLKPYEHYVGQPILVWGDSRLFITLLESWIGIKYDKAKHLQLWLQNMIPKGFSKRKFFNILQKITLISLVEYANCYSFDRETEETNTMKFEIQDRFVKYYIGLKILSYPSILEKVVEYLLYIINEFKGSIQDLVNLINKGTLELFNLFEVEKKKFIIMCKNDYYKKIAFATKYPLYLNLINQSNSNFNNVKNVDKFEDKSLIKSDIEINPQYITPSLLKVLYRISLFERLLNNNNLEIINIFFDPMLFSSNNFFESGFFFYIFSSENIHDHNTHSFSTFNQQFIELTKSNFNKSLCKVGCIMNLISENKQNSNNTGSSHVFMKQTNIELLVKGGRFDNWYINASNDKNIIFYKNANDKNFNKISAVGFEVVLERILFKILNDSKYKKFNPTINSNPNTSHLFSMTGIYVFIYNNNIKYQIKTFKLKQMLLLKGIKCQRNISCNNHDFTKIKNYLKNIFPSLHWIVHIIKGSVNDNRKSSSNFLMNKSSPSHSTVNNMNSNPFHFNNCLDNQSYSHVFSESRYKLEWCSNTDVHLASYAKEFICNYSNSNSSNNSEITFETEISTVQFLVDFYAFNNN